MSVYFPIRFDIERIEIVNIMSGPSTFEVVVECRVGDILVCGSAILLITVKRDIQ